MCPNMSEELFGDGHAGPMAGLGQGPLLWLREDRWTCTARPGPLGGLLPCHASLPTDFAKQLHSSSFFAAAIPLC